MAEEALGKTVEQLKKERTSAKSSFTKQANFLRREAHRLIESELKDEFSKLSSEVRKVFETNDDYKAGLLAEIEAKVEDGAEALLSVQQEADFKKAAEDCNTRFDKVSELVQDNLWKRYGQDEVLAAVFTAEKACDRTTSIPVDSIGYKSYGMQLELLMRMVKEATGALLNWERWIPTTERKPLEGRVQKLKELSCELEARKVEFAWARKAAEDARASETSLREKRDVTAPVGQIMPVVKIKPTSLPTFSGNKRDFYSWKRDWEILQRQGEPEVKKIQLVDSIDEKIAKELRLSSYNTAADIFRVLENRYGNKITIAMEIVGELERIPAVKGNQPRRVIELIQLVEKALADLTDLGNVGAIKNPLVIKSIESKLPEFVKRDWLVYMTDPANGITPENHFDALLKFLKKEEEILERLEQLKISERAEKPERRNYAFTRTTKKVPTEGGCIVCGAEKHKDKIFFCKGLKLAEKKSIVRRLGACKKCLGCHEDENRCSDSYLCRNKDCKRGASSDHHYFLCPKGELKIGSEGKVVIKDGKKENRLTDEQEEFLAQLSPELAERCKKAFTNKAKMVNCSEKDQTGLVGESGLQELPVIMMLMEVTTNAGQKVGALIDLASDTNDITHEAADRLKLRGLELKLRRGQRVKTPKGTEKAHQFICYGLEEIAKVHRSPSRGEAPEWQDVYAAQVHDMAERKAAKKLTKEMIENWKGPVWYVSHLVAPNPHSTTTPVRLVWNSSQKFKGLSMNDLLLKGPDVLNAIRAVLLRFRKGVFAALGDIKKMYNSVWLEEREVHLHRFLWRDTQEEEIGEYAITRVNIGDRPAGCIAQLAMRETARLARFAHLKEESRILEEDSYVDDILTSHNDQERLNEIMKGLKEILTAGGFTLKPWVRSGQSGRQKADAQACGPEGSVLKGKTVVLPNQLRDEDNKALGTGYLVEEDKLFIMASINFSKRKEKMRTGQDLLKSEVRLKTPNPLTRRHLLSQVAGLYDPIGLVTPAKQKGAILVRKAFQETGSGSLTRQTWDKELSENLREEAIKLFEEYVQLSQVKFHRSLTPVGWQGKPWGITFSDGSDKTYGAVLYLRWSTNQRVEVRLVESKAKLTPLDQKGDAVKAEICGAVFAV
ncbi:hypothetical protein QQF64_020507 [Cirrhinus molitorella]|uniref:Gag-pol fusion poly n=1 Tax=Cirrhinus molitorella TaxID=172907 RepID=A0ABR3L9H0_9TELE